ncbi:hypothetical protein DACRYDRAFT_117488 [Dacryopinax primogenitus]|uniref:F-box domain-containing protein n=1 Tax=Dacryopinax primogenitus (strain DJM 731) TaxID=1858805 RepID=M5FW22_DACPD|nr:uncharacterized protein DACRYDRAFT_117488 [Dacryopinax primogenitus]EJT99849.1 hypothetical protein DACRYDRAFT_117488 [Dacryopinax primogenitus]
MATPSPLARRPSAPQPQGRRPLAVSTTRRPSGGPAAVNANAGAAAAGGVAVMSPISLPSPPVQRPSPPQNGRGTPRVQALKNAPPVRSPHTPFRPPPQQRHSLPAPAIQVLPSPSPPPPSESTHTPHRHASQTPSPSLRPVIPPSSLSSSPASFWATTEDLASDDDLITEVDEHAPDEEFIRSLQGVGALHTKQLRSLKRLLEQSQTGAASQLHALQAESRNLRLEMARERVDRERAERALERERVRRPPEATLDMTQVVRGSLEGSIRDSEVRGALRTLRPAERMRLIHIILDSCLPGDISSMIRLLDKYLKSTFDVLGNLPEELAIQTLAYLSVPELLAVEPVSHTWQGLVHHPALWRGHCLRLSATDPVPLRPPANPSGWEPLYRGLHHRESNWSLGLAQSLRLLPGHTGYVTTLHLRGTRLFSGSYDETVRVWDLTSGEVVKELKVKAVSCLESLAEEEVFAVGFHDVGRVQIFSSLTWSPLQTLQGHLYGIRALSLNSTYLVSAGADKALVCWDWRAGTKIVRFGQQTNLNIGVQLLGEDRVVGVTVDGVVRTFSIPRREMLSQFRLSDLGLNLLADGRLGGVGQGQNTLQWFAAKGRNMTCATKSLILRLEWPEEGSDSSRTTGLPSPLASRHPTQRKVSAPLPSPGFPPGVATPQRTDTLRRSSLGRVSVASAASTPRSVTFDVPLGKLPRIVSITDTPDISVGAVDPIKGRVVTSTRFSTRTGADRRIFVSTCRATQSGQSPHRPPLDGEQNSESGSSQPAQAGNDILPITGIWQASSEELAMPEKNPMSIALDHEEMVVGCADGTIYVLGFVGDTFRVGEPDQEG